MFTEVDDNTFSTALGIKGRAKLRPHPKSQLPHIELRRVDPPADASDNSGATLYFSFFSAKPLNCKAGRELLLSLGRIDDRHAGRSIMLEGMKCVPEADEQPVIPPTAEVPLKFRKARWGGPAADDLRKDQSN
ncbi:hypothetical protein CPB85DRAFT_882470 [Mucidula mucida]|nr:hypothetical protein CPB85DRAFT_882470 [Mucidula mucida]